MGEVGILGRGRLLAPFLGAVFSVLFVLTMALLPSCALGSAVGVSIDELEQRLREADTNGDGFLSITEVGQLLAVLRENENAKAGGGGPKVAKAQTPGAAPPTSAPQRAPLPESVKQRILAADTNHDGALDASEQRALIASYRDQQSAAPPRSDGNGR